MYRSFQGLPFAAPPVGPLRLAPPQPAAAWSEERKADGWVDIKCTQYGFISDGPAGVRSTTIHIYLPCRGYFPTDFLLKAPPQRLPVCCLSIVLISG